MEKRSTRALAAACALMLFVTAACGGDDDTAVGDDGGGEQAAGTDVDEFCDLMTELDSQDAPPSNEQMEQVKQVRPDEVGAEVDYVADAFIEADGDIGAVFTDPEIEGKFTTVDEFTAANCPGLEHLAGGDEGGEVNPEFADYCAAAAALDESDGPPTTEQIAELVELAPDEIGEEAQVVLDAFEANDGDIGAVFADPAVNEAIGVIEDFEGENCGGGSGEDEDGDTEAAEGATVVPVVGVDFGYEQVPATVAAGPVALEFTNEGETVHEMALFSLDGKTVEQRIAETEAAFEADDEDAIEDLGYAFTPPGGEARYVNADLEPGEYVLLCFIPGPEGKPHHELGMQQTFSVN